MKSRRLRIERASLKQKGARKPRANLSWAFAMTANIAQTTNYKLQSPREVKE
jgi:hypothetical protein